MQHILLNSIAVVIERVFGKENKIIIDIKKTFIDQEEFIGIKLSLMLVIIILIILFTIKSVFLMD